MQKCRVCGNPVEKNAVWCPSCGVGRICLNCGYKLDERFNFCPNCGELRSFTHINYTDHEDFSEFAVPIGNLLKIKKTITWRFESVNHFRRVYAHGGKILEAAEWCRDGGGMTGKGRGRAGSGDEL